MCITIFTFSVMFAAMQLQPYDDGNFKEFHSVSLKMCKQMSDILEKEEPSRRDLEETDELLNQWTRHVESCVAVAQVLFDFLIFTFYPLTVPEPKCETSDRNVKTG